ncbi:barstar family protein [Bacillus cereus group sp. BfR-BA-01354]|uniref:barstar family protein n=1 Tax=Bacillus cereus group TaxID=86661 RepID=UPI001F5AA8F9
MKTTKELHKLLKERLGFPDFYGENWDAFWDAISGLIELPTTVQFIGMKQFDAVKITKDLPDKSITKGQIGTILEDYDNNLILGSIITRYS